MPLIQNLVKLQLTDPKFLKNLGAKAIEPTAVQHFNDRWMKFNMGLSLMAPVITGFSNPIIMDLKYRKNKKMSPQKRHELVLQEASNQFVTMALHVMTFLSFSALTVRFLNAKAGKELWRQKDELIAAGKMAQEVAERFDVKKFKLDKTITSPVGLFVGNVGGLFAFGVLRPLLGATVFRKLQERGQSRQKQDAPTLQKIGQQPTLYHPPHMVQSGATSPFPQQSSFNNLANNFAAHPPIANQSFNKTV